MRWRLTIRSSMLLAALVLFAVQARALDTRLMDMSEKMDKIEKQDFQAAIDRATSCIRSRNFDCAEAELAKAAKFANTSKDKSALLAGQNGLKSEKQQLAMEIRRAEEARQAAARKEEADREQRESDERWAQANREREAEQRRSEAEDRQSAGGSSNARLGFAANAALMNSMTSQINSAYGTGGRTQAVRPTGSSRTTSEQTSSSNLPPPKPDAKFDEPCFLALNENGPGGAAAAQSNARARASGHTACLLYKGSGSGIGVSK